MPDQRVSYDDAERIDPKDRKVDGDWDGLISNPNLREAFNRAVAEGHPNEDAIVIAEASIFGTAAAESKFGEERVAEVVQKGPSVRSRGSILKGMDGPDDYEKCDDALLSAHEAVVQWNADKALGEYDLSKAPGMWESRDQVPDWVIEALEQLIRSGEAIWHGDYERLPPSADAEIERILEQRLTQPQGWSLDSLLRDLKDKYPEQDDEYLLSILRNETSAVLNTAREEAYERSEDRRDEEFDFDWIGPTDWRTTDTCLAIEERIENEGGSVPMDQLRQILYEEALAHADAEGTPERVDDWQPHWQCRRTMVRRVQTL